MAEQLQNSHLDRAAHQAQDERPVWITALFWGVLLGATVSFVAALRRRLRPSGRPVPSPFTRPPLEPGLASTEPGVIEPLPGELAPPP